MNQWSEENFLDRLMPELRRESRVRAESCPDADLLTAFAEDRVSGFVRESVTAHLAQCQRCSEICARLVNFQMATVHQQDAEWPNVEKRLTNWMEGFVAGKRSAVEPERVLSVREAPATGFRWRMPWALGTAAALGVIVGGVVVGGMFVARRGWKNPTVQVATREPVVQAPNPVVTPVPAPSTQPATGGQEAAKTSPAALSQAGKSAPETHAAAMPETAPGSGTGASETNLAPGPKSAQASTEAKFASPARSAATHSAGRSTTAAHASTTPNGIRAAAPVMNPTPTPDSTPASSADGGNSDQVAEQFEPPNLNPNDHIQTATQAGSAGPPKATKKYLFKGYDVSLNSGTSARGAASTPAHAAATARPSASPLPAQLRLEANKRLWIRASLLNQNPDGSFTFSGTLLQPFDQGGVRLDSETRLEGAGLVKDGSVTISVNSVKYRGVFYFLQTSSDQSGDLKPGAGKALQFHDGQIIEMWFLAPSVYEKAPARSSGSQSKP